MTIHDRGMTKWQAAFQLPELAKTQRNFWLDTERIRKPIVDEQEAEEFDLRIAYATEYGHAVKLSIWVDGFITVITGRINSLKPNREELCIEIKTGEFKWVTFESVIGLKVVN